MKNVIYKISNNINDKIYIGSSKEFNNRINQHRYNLKKGNHHSILLQRHYNKYGIESLVFEIIEKCSFEDLIKREQFYIDSLEPFFNIRRTAESNFGLKRSDESKLKQSIKMKGRIVSKEVRDKISKSQLGKIVSIETKVKISNQKIGINNHMFEKFGNKHHNFGKKFKHKNPKIPKKVIDTKTNIIYENAKIASSELNIPFGTFSKYLLNYTKKITNFKYYEG